MSFLDSSDGLRRKGGLLVILQVEPGSFCRSSSSYHQRAQILYRAEVTDDAHKNSYYHLFGLLVSSSVWVPPLQPLFRVQPPSAATHGNSYSNPCREAKQQEGKFFKKVSSLRLSWCYCRCGHVERAQDLEENHPCSIASRQIP